MLEQELINEFDNGVRMFGYEENNMPIGVMGIQELQNVALIRHAYTLGDHQRTEIGKALLQCLLNVNKNTSLLVGTWQDAAWAIRFYVKNGFFVHGRNNTERLLGKYWQVSTTQMKHSVVLEKGFDLKETT